MVNNTTNLFILNSDNTKSQNLSQFIIKTFGNAIIVTNFTESRACLKSIDKETDMVILDDSYQKPFNIELIKKIKIINSKTEVVVFTVEKDIATIIEAYHKGLNDYVIKEEGASAKIKRILIRIINKPIRILVREFNISTFMATFLLTFVTMGLVVLFFIYYVI